jgi:ribosomal protein S18 acetylase RimI-like enzyme
VVIRSVTSDEYEIVGAMTVLAYVRLDGHIPDAAYEAELADVAARADAPGTEVLVAADDDGRVLGAVTFIADDSSPFSEHAVDGAASIRMLAVAVDAQRRGVGEALTRACIDRARALGRTSVVLHSTPWMHAAHRLYARLGFRRDPQHDWQVTPELLLLSFSLEI